MFAISEVSSKLNLPVINQEDSGLRCISEQHLRLFIENAPDAFFIHDLQGRFVDVNKAAHQGLGYTREELLALKVFDVEMEANRDLLLNKVWPALNHGSSKLMQGRHMRKDGSIFPVDVNITCMKDNGTDLIFALAHDISESESIKEKLQSLALTDELTKLPNRRSFIYSLEKEISKTRRKSEDLSLLMIDIDFFKKINDKYGHSVGDLALKHFAKVSKIY